MINSNTKRFIRKSRVFIRLIQLENFSIDNQSTEYLLLDIDFQNDIPSITINLDLSKNLTAKGNSNKVDDANYIIENSQELLHIDFDEGITSEIQRCLKNVLNSEKSTLALRMIFNQELEITREVKFEKSNSRLKFI